MSERGLRGGFGLISLELLVFVNVLFFASSAELKMGVWSASIMSAGDAKGTHAAGKEEGKNGKQACSCCAPLLQNKHVSLKIPLPMVRSRLTQIQRALP